MARLDQERQNRLAPKRLGTTKILLEQMGYKVDIMGNTTLVFFHNNHKVMFYPYSGWHTGKSIKDGRG
jgi:hypothetical protein